MKISFIDFWDGFDPRNNFLYFLLRDVYQNIEVVDPKNAEVIIFSVFGNTNQIYNHCKKIFFTGENIRPDFNKCDHSISFDFDDYRGRNIRIPLWYYYIDWFNVGSYGNPSYLIPVNYLYEPNEFSKKEKIGFCSAVYSNPVGIRNQVVKLLNVYKKVDCYGKVSGFNILQDGERQKLDIISNYKFNICFENSSYPGYYTEKLLHAKVAGCIPIYYSDVKVYEDFNKSCLLFYNNIDEMIHEVVNVDNNNVLYNNIINEPLFTKKIELDSIKDKIFNII